MPECWPFAASMLLMPVKTVPVHVTPHYCSRILSILAVCNLDEEVMVYTLLRDNTKTLLLFSQSDLHFNCTAWNSSWLCWYFASFMNFYQLCSPKFCSKLGFKLRSSSMGPCPRLLPQIDISGEYCITYWLLVTGHVFIFYQHCITSRKSQCLCSD